MDSRAATQFLTELASQNHSPAFLAELFKANDIPKPVLRKVARRCGLQPGLSRVILKYLEETESSEDTYKTSSRSPATATTTQEVDQVVKSTHKKPAITETIKPTVSPAPVKDEPTKPKSTDQCTNCKLLGHLRNDCTACTYCGKAHSSSECPNPDARMFCWYCDKRGHRERHCKDRVCGRCGKTGHPQRECPLLD